MEYDETLKSPVVRAFVSAFIVFYLVAVIIWICPWSRAKETLVKPYEEQMYFFGCWQGFAVFAPDPRKVNFRIHAKITYDDGSVFVWHYPAMEKLGFFERYYREHYRKFGNDCLNSTELLWRDFARFVARKNDRAGKHPVTVALTRTWADVLPIEKGMGKPNPEQSEKYQFYLYKVESGDLN